MSEDDDRATGAVEPGGPRPTWGKVALREDERRFLEGPQRRFADLDRATRISAEFVKGFRALRALAPATLVQTRKIMDFPLILVGSEFWRPLVAFLEERMLRAGTIERGDLERIVLTDDVHEVVARLCSCALAARA
jgi:hypothetical protein